MIRLIARRVLYIIPTLLIVSFGVFLLVKLVPNDPAIGVAGGVEATPEEIAQVREELGVNDPFFVQYGRWLGDAVTGDLGNSYISRAPVVDDLEIRLPVTLSLVLAAAVFAIVLGVPLGILSGLRPNGALDQGSRGAASLAAAIPSYLVGLLLVVVFAVELKWLPPSGFVKLSQDPLEWLRYIVLPAASLGFVIAASIMRQLRAGLIDELDTNHIRTVWAIGGGRPRVVGRHGLKNAASPAITVVGIQIAALVGSAVIVEQIFSIPGLGVYLLTAITSGDIPAIQGCVLVLTMITILMGLVIDILYAVLNPKVRVADDAPPRGDR